MSDPRIGRKTDKGVEYPTQTLSGAPYNRAAQIQPPAVIQLNNTEFVVIDTFPPPGFNRNAAVEALRKPSRKVERGSETPSE